MKTALTKRLVDELQPALGPAALEYTVWDSTVQGLGLRVRESGAKVWVFKFSRHSRQGKATLGPYGALTVDAARKEANLRLAMLARGEDPAKAGREAKGAMKLKSAVEAFEERYLPGLAPSSQRDYKRILHDHILPRLGPHTLVREVGIAEIQAMHRALRETPRLANYAVAVLSVLLTQCERWEERPPRSNPCYLIERFKETKRTRALTAEELPRFGRALRVAAESHGAPFVDCIRLLVLTSLRKGEAMRLRWDQVDIKGKCLVFGAEQHKTGRKVGEKTIPLGGPALALLRQLHPGETAVALCPWVFPGNVAGQPVANLEKAWATVREVAELQDLHLHDLRHTFGTHGVDLGENLKHLSQIFGHSTVKMTERYTHPELAPAQAVADRVARHIARAMAGKTGRRGRRAS